MTSSEPLLVVIDPLDSECHLLHEAAAYARGTGSDLVVLSVMSSADYRARARAVNGLRQSKTTFTYDQAVESSRTVALNFALAAIGDGDVEFTAVGYVGTTENAVLAASARYGCVHVLVAGHRRGVWDILRRVPDPATSIERSFPGNVTVFHDHLLGEPSASEATI